MASTHTFNRAPSLDVDFTEPGLSVDPFRVYDEIREVGPVVWNGLAKAWMVVGWAALAEALDDPQGERFGVVGARKPGVKFWHEAPNMIVADGAEHRRLRQGVSRYFTPAVVKKRWQERVREVVQAQLAPLVQGDGTIDLVSDFTRIPVIIVAELLGVPEEHHDDFRHWSHEIVSNLRFGQESEEARRRMEHTIGQVKAYLMASIEQHRREQPDDLLTVMVNIPDWSEAEILSSAVNILMAGYDTTAKLMGECLVALERHPDQRRLLVDSPKLVPNAIEEVLRCYGAAHVIVRLACEDTVLGGAELKSDEVMYLMLAAGNRDPGRWPDPNRFDVCRQFKPHLGQPHLGFGLGPHICLGAALARVEVQVAIETLLRLAPEYQLRDIDYGNAVFAHGPEGGTIEARAVATA